MNTTLKMMEKSRRQDCRASMIVIIKSRKIVKRNCNVIVKLAAINIPVFSGDYKDWFAFNDMFIALVHMNDQLSPVQKFFYLRSSKSGTAANAIQSLEMTAKKYDTAWKTLTARYSNKKVLAQGHTNSIFDLESISSESSIKLINKRW